MGIPIENIKKHAAAELINERQKALMQHALGMDHRNTYKRAGREWYRPYRNYYDAGGNDPEWEDLVKKGIAEKRDGRNGGTWYWVSKTGLEVLSALLNIYIFSDNSDCAADAKNDIIEILIEHACYSGYGCWLPLGAENIAVRARLPKPVAREALRILCEDGIASHTYYGEGTEDGVMCTHGYKITKKGIEENKALYDQKWKEECDRINESLRAAAEANAEVETLLKGGKE